jgi:hypothetical protein
VGRFATEAEAQALRDRAVRAGYAGAFRIRIGPRWSPVPDAPDAPPIR